MARVMRGSVALRKYDGTFSMLRHSFGNFLGRDFEDAQAVKQLAKAAES